MIYLSGSAPPGAEALNLASFRGRDVVRTPAHLAHEPLLLHLATELPESLLELLRILDYDSHNRTRIPECLFEPLTLPSPRRGEGNLWLLQTLGAQRGEEQVAANAEQHQETH